MQQFSGLLLAGFAAPVIGGCRRHIGVPGQLLHGGDVGAGVQQVRDEAAAQIVRRQMGDLCLLGPLGQDDLTV